MKNIKHSQTFRKGEKNEKHVDYESPQYENVKEMLSEPEFVQKGIVFAVNGIVTKKLNSWTYKELKSGTDIDKIQKLTLEYRLYVPERTKKTPVEKCKSDVRKLDRDDQIKFIRDMESELKQKEKIT